MAEDGKELPDLMDQSIVLLGFDETALTFVLEFIGHGFELVHGRDEVGDEEGKVASFHVPLDNGNQIGARFLGICQTEEIVV